MVESGENSDEGDSRNLLGMVPDGCSGESRWFRMLLLSVLLPLFPEAQA